MPHNGSLPPHLGGKTTLIRPRLAVYASWPSTPVLCHFATQCHGGNYGHGQETGRKVRTADHLSRLKDKVIDLKDDAVFALERFARGKGQLDIDDERAIAAQRAQQRFKLNLAAENASYGWVETDTQSVYRPSGVAYPIAKIPGWESSYEAVQAKSLNEAAQLMATEFAIAKGLTTAMQAGSKYFNFGARSELTVLSQEMRYALAQDLPATGRSGVLGGAASDAGVLEVGIPWGGSNKAQGMPWEDYLEVALPKSTMRLPANFDSFDFYDFSTGTAISAKTLNTLTNSRLANPANRFTKMKGYVDDVVKFEFKAKGGFELTSEMILARQVNVAIPPSVNARQLQQIERGIVYGASHNVKVVVTKVK